MESKECRIPDIPCRAADVKPFIVMEILERAQEMERAGEHVVHLEVGEPDFDTPPAVIEAAIEALKEGKTHYTHSMGLVELREAIARDYHDRYRVEVDPGCIIVTSGTSAAMSLVFSVLLEPGREVVLTDPHYACYPNYIKFAGGSPVYVKVDEHTGFQFTPDNLRDAIGPSTAAALLNSPSNPAGTVLGRETLEAAACLGVPVISDEIYHGLVYEGEAPSILECTDMAFVINGFSKLYAMTGWRVGFVIAPKPCVRTMQKLHQNFFISANSFVQWAAIAALEKTEEDVRRMVETYGRRRRFIVDELKKLGFSLDSDPTGAFYVLLNAKHIAEGIRRLGDYLKNRGII